MPKPKAGESRNDFVSRCIPICMAEGLSQKAAIGKCEGMFSEYSGKSNKKKKKKVSRGK